MVDEDRLREWVEQKLDEGVSEERIRRSLRDTGHDPSIVDEVQDPFSGDEVETASDEDLSFTGEETGSRGQEEQGFQASGGASGDGGLDSGIGAESLEEEKGRSPGSKDTGGEDEGGGGLSLSLPSLSMPELPLWPAVAAAVILIGVSGYLFVPWASLGLSLPSVSVPAVELPSGGGEGAPSSGDACPDVGVRINSISSSGGSTRADVLVTRGSAEVVLEVYDGSRLAGSTTKRVGGPGSMTVSATGDRAVLRPTGCTEFHDAVAIG
ncbi:MAG: hypothetical protein ABEJ64_01810 [Candidatus Nanohaloarchaea archaeon]